MNTIFNWKYYLSTHQDLQTVLKTDKDALSHFNTIGYREKRRISPLLPMDFEPNIYKQNGNPSSNPYQHYLNTGRHQNISYRRINYNESSDTSKIVCILTRTSGRRNYFLRCFNSVLPFSSRITHRVLYDNKNDLQSYLEDKSQQIVLHYMDRAMIDKTYKTPSPPSPFPNYNLKRLLHNLYFNEVYSLIEEPWVYHLDDDNYIYIDGFNDMLKRLPTYPIEVEVVIVRIYHFNPTKSLPDGNIWKQKTILPGHIDTACFFVRTSLAKRVKWDGWSVADYRFIKRCSQMAKKTIWVDVPVAVIDKGNCGQRGRDI